MSHSCKTIFVISHTHWDREWYLPFEEFRWKLVLTIDNLLNLMEQNPNYVHFLLDGQIILLDDYLAIRPDHLIRIKNLVQANRFHIGPWYVLADEFLVSGEALIRNLLLGHQKAQEFGAIMQVGYTPDTFGHIAQLPQLLKGFQIDSAVFWRGFDDGNLDVPTEVRWKSPDGSEVLVIHLRMGYGPAAQLPKNTDAALAQLLFPLCLLIKQTTSSALLLLNGSDHLPPQPHLPDLLNQLTSRFQTDDPLQGKTLVQIYQALLASHFSNNSFPAISEDKAGFLNQLLQETLSSLKNANFQHGALNDYVQKIKQDGNIEELPLISGEQHSSKYISVLPGVFSARMYLKQANFRTQRLLQRWAEPFATIAWWLGASYPTQWLHYAWTLLLQNHPHDSICGCSVDETHKDMETRFRQSQQVGNRILYTALNYINAQILDKLPKTLPDQPHAVLRIYNPLPFPRTDIVRILLTLDPPPRKPTQYTLYDPSGTPIPCQIQRGDEIDPALYPLINQHLLPTSQTGEPVLPNASHQLLLSFIAKEVPGLGYGTYYLGPPPPRAPPPPVGGVVWRDGVVESGRWVVRVDGEGGRVVVVDRESGWEFGPLLGVVDGGDVGDEYTFCPPVRDEVVVGGEGGGVGVRVVEEGPVVVTVEVGMEVMVPGQVAVERDCRGTERVAMAVQTLVSVYGEVPRIDCVTKVHNLAKDHRLRLLFTTGLATDVVWADTPFHVTRRPIVPPPVDWVDQTYPVLRELMFRFIQQAPRPPGKPAGWFEDPSATHAMQSFVTLTDHTAGLLIATQGIPEFEVLTDPPGTIALTLLRSVGWLSRPDLTTRRGDAGPHIPTPDAQCLGTHYYAYSIIPYSGTWHTPGVLQQVQAFCAPLGVHSLPHLQHGHLPPQYSFLTIQPPNVVLSCLKKAETQKATILRLWEATGQPTKTKIHFSNPISTPRLCTFAEHVSPQKPLRSQKSTTYTFSLQPYRIQSLHFTTTLDSPNK